MKRLVTVIFEILIVIFIFCKISFSAVAVYPVDGLLGDSYYPRDTGSSAKGARKNYTTVWEGKYTGNYLDRFKGSGGHPGMDITGAVGEKIYSVAAGTVVYATCYGASSWGNLVVVKHTAEQFCESSVYDYYSVYAHLREIYVSVGNNVNAGDKLGLIGGGLTDPCHGDSTGRHLHFQIEKIEKTKNWVRPYWPPNNDGNTPDPTNIGLNTIDPIKFIESNYSYFVGRSESYGWKFQDTTGSQFWSEPFADCYRLNGGMEALGYPVNNVYLSTNFLGYSSSGSPAVYVQDLSKNGHIFSLVLNPYVANSSYGYKLGVTFPIHGAIRTNWIPNFKYLGPPVSNEYYYYMNNVCSQANQRVVQWFEPSDNNFVCMVYNPNTLSAIFGSPSYTGIPLDQDRIKQDVVSNSVGGQGGGSFLTAPSNLQASSISSQSIQLTWTLPDGTSNYGIKVYSAGTLIKTLSWTDNVVIDNLSANTTYCFQISIFDQSSGDESSLSSEVCATTVSAAANTVNGYIYVDIGTDTPKGKVTYNSDTKRYVVNGTGNGINGNSTQCKYLYTTQNSCSALTTRVISHSAIGPGSMAGLMFAENTNSDSNFVLLATTPDRGIICQYRQNGTITTIGGDTFDFPVYLRLTRSVNSYIAQYSTTGNRNDWITLASLNFAMTSNILAGIFATPGNSIVSSAVFEGLSATAKPEKPTLRIQ